MILKNTFFLLVAGIFVFSSFTITTSDRAKLLQRKWKPIEFSFNGEIEKEPESTDKRMEFRENGEYWVDNKKDGSWKFSKDEKSIIVHPDAEKQDMQLMIDKLTKTELAMSIHRDGDVVKLRLIPAK